MIIRKEKWIQEIKKDLSTKKIIISFMLKIRFVYNVILMRLF